MPAAANRFPGPSWVVLFSLLGMLTGCLLRTYQPTTGLRAKLKGTVLHLDPSSRQILDDWHGQSKTALVSLVIPYVDDCVVKRGDQALQLTEGMPIDAGLHRLKIFVSFEKFKDAVNGGAYGDFYFKFAAGRTYRLEPPRHETGDDQTVYIRLYVETVTGDKAVDMVPVEYKRTQTR